MLSTRFITHTHAGQTIVHTTLYKSCEHPTVGRDRQGLRDVHTRNFVTTAKTDRISNDLSKEMQRTRSEAAVAAASATVQRRRRIYACVNSISIGFQ